MMILTSSQFSFQCLTGMRPSVHDSRQTQNAAETASIFPMRKRVIMRTIMSGYLTEPQNEKALYVGLQVVLALVQSEKRHYRTYSKRVGHWALESDTERMIDKVIGTELMKLALELNLFVRLMTTIQFKENKTLTQEIDLLITVTIFLQCVLKSLKPSFQNVQDARVVPLLRIIIKQGIMSQSVLQVPLKKTK